MTAVGVSQRLAVSSVSRSVGQSIIPSFFQGVLVTATCTQRNASPSSSPLTAMDASFDIRGNMMEWDESAVAAYLARLGYSQYEDQIRGEWSASDDHA